MFEFMGLVTSSYVANAVRGNFCLTITWLDAFMKRCCNSARRNKSIKSVVAMKDVFPAFGNLYSISV